MPLQSLFPGLPKPATQTSGFNIPQGWSAIDNNSNDVYRNYLGFGRKRETPTAGAWFNDMPDIFGDLEQNKLYNQQQDQAFADKFKDQQIIRRMIGEGLYEYGLLGQDGSISNNWTHQYSKDNWLDKNIPGITMAALAAMTTAGLGGFGSPVSGVEGLSGMDLAADAALGTGNNVMTAGAGLGSGATTAGGVGSMFSNATNPALIESAVGTPGYGMSSAGLGAATSGGGTMDFLKDLGKSIVGGQGGGISNLGNLASLFSNYKQYSNTGDLMDDIRSIYSPDGVYAKELEKQLARRDAAAGRNSQYGPRLAELMARLGDSQARSLSGLGGMMTTQQGGLNGMVGAGSRLLEGTGALEKLFSIFGD